MTVLDLYQWSCALLTFGAMFVLSRGKRWGWLANIAVSVLWMGYAGCTAQWGLIALNVAMLYAGVAGWVRSKPEPEPEPEPIPSIHDVLGTPGTGRAISTGRCCAMSRKFITGVTGARADKPMPTEAADYIIHWSPGVTLGQVKQKPSRRAGPSQMILLGAAYCQWCGCNIREAVRKRAGDA